MFCIYGNESSLFMHVHKYSNVYVGMLFEKIIKVNYFTMYVFHFQREVNVYKVILLIHECKKSQSKIFKPKIFMCSSNFKPEKNLLTQCFQRMRSLRNNFSTVIDRGQHSGLAVLGRV